MGTGIEIIAAERQRQIESEGWTVEHDDKHTRNELAKAAACYAMGQQFVFINEWVNKRAWPWENRWWKPTPKDRIKELAKAGALIAAEIDRLQRKG